LILCITNLTRRLALREKNFNPTILEEGLGAISIAVCVVASPLLRYWYLKWGASPEEVKMPLPGDERVPDPRLQSTRAINIHAPAAEVWPWLVQMGQGRGGLYSYEILENLANCDMHNADRILPEHQNLKVGDKVRLSQDESVPSFTVTAIVAGRAIILGGDDPPTTWAFVLEPIDDETSRLLIRWRQDYEPTFGNVLGWRLVTDPITFVMERKMLQGIKARAEARVN
jgi:hypothetical protein